MVKDVVIKIKGDYRCQRLRLLTYLTDRGFKPKDRFVDFYASKPDNIRYYWTFETTDELIKALHEYNGATYVVVK